MNLVLLTISTGSQQSRRAGRPNGVVAAYVLKKNRSRSAATQKLLKKDV